MRIQNVKKFKLIRNAIIIAAVCLLITFFTVDFLRVKSDEPPIFAVPLIRYYSGSIDYYGAGYKIWKDVNILTGGTEYYISSWFVPKYLF
ncbi:MAG: hypothetical protein LBL80_03235 [Ruminococcus sp.]|jgi:hypothetical protein|nr:hypothetical protein [Ruminococcus sp.]